ncbi:trans-aconitate 2-methyltransferase [Anatilimnocola sp. NA78]|uniref:class I SAM-dependent methyltransferase n=1 Tax=Anatilimnocola sp. NA78 TaxID=3415683 RepID=UPI003CE4CB5B
MSPTDIGRSYDAITDRWSAPEHPLSGLAALQRAVQFVKTRCAALDAGCGCNGRLIDYLVSENFEVEGVDVSEHMVGLARKRNPTATFHHADICEWQLSRKYDLILGWDSIWHVPLAAQATVLQKLCKNLNSGGVLVFTLGGLDASDEVQDAHMGVAMYTATLGIPKTLELLAQYGCVCRHLEYDQFPELHVYVIAQKI